MGKMRRDVITNRHLPGQLDDHFVPKTLARASELAGNVPGEIFSIEGRYDVERRLHGHVVVLAKRGR